MNPSSWSSGWPRLISAMMRTNTPDSSSAVSRTAAPTALSPTSTRPTGNSQAPLSRLHTSSS